MSNTNLSPLTADAIQVGKSYRSKRPQKVFGGVDYDDRLVLYVSPDREIVQYDSQTVRIGRHFPKVPMERFLKWASHEVDADGERVSCPTTSSSGG